MTKQDRFRFRIWSVKRKEYHKLPTYNYIDGTFNLCSYEDDIIEQSTGLKDNNGKLIYEGDIIEDDNTKSDRGVVFFDKYSARFMVKMYKYNQKVLIKKNVRVVGNIHEENKDE